MCNEVWWNGPVFLKFSESEWPLYAIEVMKDYVSVELRKHATEVSFTLLSMEDGGIIANID